MENLSHDKKILAPEPKREGDENEQFRYKQ